MSKLRSVRLKRFKQLAEFDLDVDDTTVLIGANNAGKSSVLQALHFAVGVAQTAKLVGEGVKWATNRFELSFNPAQLLYAPVADVLSLSRGGTLIESADDQIEIELFRADGESCLVALRRGRNRNIQVSIRGRVLGERLMNMFKPYTVYAPGLAGIAKEERYMSPGVVRRVVARGDANLVLRNVLLMLKESEKRERAALSERIEKLHLEKLAAFHAGRGPEPVHPMIERARYRGPWSRFLNDMQALFPGLTLTVSFDADRDETIDVFFRQQDGPQLPIDAAGTSILQASQILAYVALFEPEVLILDEPDSHLHPNNQRLLCDLVTSLAEKRGFRALLSTHSRHVLDALKDRAKVVWMNGGRRVDYETVSTPTMLMELGALDSVDYFSSGRFSCLVATEDSKRESLSALNALLQSNAFPLAEFEIRPYSGCSKVDSAKVLRSFLLDKAPSVKFVLHRDRDYMNDEAVQSMEQSLRAIDAHAFITEFSDIEGYFLNANHIASLNQKLTRERAQELVDEATKSTRDKSVMALINQRTEAAIRNRAGGPPHNAGELAAKAYADYDSDPPKWRRGKVVLNELRSLLNKELGEHPKILERSEHLRTPVLDAIRAAVWPPKANAKDAVAAAMPGSTLADPTPF